VLVAVLDVAQESAYGLAQLAANGGGRELGLEKDSLPH
jgi:hypothetical protein